MSWLCKRGGALKRLVERTFECGATNSYFVGVSVRVITLHEIRKLEHLLLKNERKYLFIEI